MPKGIMAIFSLLRSIESGRVLLLWRVRKVENVSREGIEREDILTKRDDSWLRVEKVVNQYRYESGPLAENWSGYGRW